MMAALSSLCKASQLVRSLLLCGLIGWTTEAANAFVLLKGPYFYNGGTSSADLYVSTAGGEIRVLSSFPAKTLYGSRKELFPRKIRVVANEQAFELSEEAIDRQAKSIPQVKQLWIFDGATVCIANVKTVDLKSPPTCAEVDHRQNR